MVSQDNIEYTRCNFCKTQEHKVIYSEGTLKLVECTKCGFNYVNPRIKLDELAKHYDEQFSLGVDAARRKLKNAPDEQQVVNDRNAWSKKEQEDADRWLDNDVSLILRYKRSGRLLDVGCGKGDRLEHAYQRGIRDIYGLELSAKAVDDLKDKFHYLPDCKKRFYNATIMDAPFSPGYFDIVTYWSVLEHVVDPLQNLERAYNLLKKSGILVLRVPNVREEFLRKYMVNATKFMLPKRLKILCGIRDLRPIACDEIFDLTKNTSGIIGGLDLELHVNHFNDRTLSMFLKHCGFRVLANKGLESPEGEKFNIKRAMEKIARTISNIPYFFSGCRWFNTCKTLVFVAQKV